MGAAIPLSGLFEARQLWRGRAEPLPAGDQPTGWKALDAVLPMHGWPNASVSEILLPADGLGELQIVLPTLARLSQGKRPVMLIAPPYLPCAMGWQQQQVDLAQLQIVQARQEDVLWAMEQCLRAGSCSAVLAWPHRADDRALRRLQIAADTGHALGFVFRDSQHLANASPAPLRLELVAFHTIRVRKCRGGNPPASVVSLDARH